MKQLFIPHLGDMIELTGPWVFTLHKEYRNTTFAKAAGLVRMEHQEMMRTDWRTQKEELHEWDSETYDDKTIMSFEAGTVLAFSRIYIRQGMSDYDSVTFRVVECVKKKLKRKRFWVKLDDANKIFCNVRS